MTNEPENATLLAIRAFRDEMRAFRDEMRRDMAALHAEMEDHRGALRELHDMVIIMRDDIHAIRVALLQLGRRVQALEENRT